MVLTQQPLRVSLFGGGSDYAEYFVQHEGAVLGMAINKFVYAGVQPMHPGQDFNYRIQYSRMEDCRTVADIKHPAVRAALQYHNITEPLEFHGFGDMPGRAGLGSSSAFCVGVLKALQKHFHLPCTNSPLDLASEAISFERYMIPETVGYQDQIFAAVGGINFITFDRFGAQVQPLKLSSEREQELEQSLILVYSGSMRDAHLMAAKQVSAIPQSDKALNNLVELAHNGKEILLDENYPLQLIGTMLHDAWRAKKQLCPEVTTPNIDALYQRGLDCGAIGGKLLGAGAGGFMLFFVPPQQMIDFREKIGMPYAQFKVSKSGSRIILNT